MILDIFHFLTFFTFFDLDDLDSRKMSISKRAIFTSVISQHIIIQKVYMIANFIAIKYILFFALFVYLGANFDLKSFMRELILSSNILDSSGSKPYLSN